VPARPERWELRLYIAGKTPRGVTALSNLERICEEHLQGRYTIDVVDLLENPRLAEEDQIIAIPTLVRKLPPPVRKIIGNLAEELPVLVGLQLRPRE
jgi:circadian clock protein KaiB